MSDGQETVTVFRSADSTAEADAAAVRDLLSEGGLHPVVLTDSEPGVPIGSTEVLVNVVVVKVAPPHGGALWRPIAGPELAGVDALAPPLVLAPGPHCASTWPAVTPADAARRSRRT